MQGKLTIFVNPAKKTLQGILGMSGNLKIEVRRAGVFVRRATLRMIGTLKIEVFRAQDQAPPAGGGVKTQRKRLLEEVGRRLALLARSTGIDKLASTPDDDYLLNTWYDNAFNRISIRTGNFFASNVNAFSGSSFSESGVMLSNVRFETLNLDGQDVEYLVLDESGAGTRVYMRSVKPATIVVNMKEYTVFVRGESSGSVAMSDVFVQSFMVDNFAKYLLVMYSGAARREIQFTLPPELEKCAVYWIMQEWFESVDEPRRAAEYLVKFDNDLTNFRFSPRHKNTSKIPPRNF